MILAGARALGALEFAQRLRDASVPAVTAGIAEATELRGRDELIREADLALIGAKRIHQDVAIYGPDLELAAARRRAEDEHHERTLASALARAVDAKDSYTRSHCQTVSQLCARIAAELGFDGDRARPHAPRRAAARRRQDRRAGRDPQQAGRAHRRRVRGR